MGDLGAMLPPPTATPAARPAPTPSRGATPRPDPDDERLRAMRRRQPGGLGLSTLLSEASGRQTLGVS